MCILIEGTGGRLRTTGFMCGICRQPILSASAMINRRSDDDGECHNESNPFVALVAGEIKTVHEQCAIAKGNETSGRLHEASNAEVRQQLLGLAENFYQLASQVRFCSKAAVHCRAGKCTAAWG